MKEVLVLFYSAHGMTKSLANLIARGIESVSGVSARIRTVPTVEVYNDLNTSTVDANEVSYVTKEDLALCSGLALGSPALFGTMASSLKHFLETTTSEWLTGALSGKPACVFTSSGSMHGGQEACLLSMILPLLHHGMLILGLPYTTSELMRTETGGTPYGASRVTGVNDDKPISDTERKLAIMQGKRLAQLVLKLSTN